jgi:hypothetical protein
MSLHWASALRVFSPQTIQEYALRKISTKNPGAWNFERGTGNVKSEMMNLNTHLTRPSPPPLDRHVPFLSSTRSLSPCLAALRRKALLERMELELSLKQGLR